MIPKISASAIYSTLGNNSSLIPLGIKDVANSCGLTAASYIAGDKVEGKDRFIDEFGTQAIWLGGIPAYKKIIDLLVYKPAKYDPEIDVRILKNPEILELAKKYAPNSKIKNSIKKAALNQSSYRGFSLAKFGISTALTALSYFKLTEFRHKYTEKKIVQDYYKQKAQNAKKNYNPEFSGVKAGTSSFGSKPSFTGGLQEFMFDPVRNMMIIDGVITSERLYKARNPQDFLGYVIKEGSFWAFMYFAGGLISNKLEKYAESKYKKSIDLDARVIESKELKSAFADGTIEKHLKAFRNADKSDAAIYEFAVNPKTNNTVVEMAKKSDIIQRLKISLFKKSEQIDTRKYIDLNDLRGVADKLEKLFNQYKDSGESLDKFFASVRKLKRGATLLNIGACIGALGVLAPAIMLLTRKNDSEYRVKKDIEAKLDKMEA